MNEGDKALLKVEVARADATQALIELYSMEGPYSIRVPLTELEPAQLDDDDVRKIDFGMSEHMYGHQISNSYHYMSCNGNCRMAAMKRLINDVLRDKAKREKSDPVKPHMGPIFIED